MDTFLACHDSRCGICDDTIRAELDEIVSTSDGDWVHADCALEEGIE